MYEENSIARGAYYRKQRADMKECFPGSNMMNMEQDRHEAASLNTVLGGVQPWLWLSECTLESFIALTLSDEQ